MIAYGIKYTIRNKGEAVHNASVDAKDLKSAKKKLGKKHGYKDGRMINIVNYSIIGYF